MKASEAGGGAFAAMRSERELLAACGLRPEVAERLLLELDGHRLALATAAELRSHGVPPQLAERLAAAFDFGRRAAVKAAQEPPTIGRPEACFDLFQDLRWRASESFHIAAIDIRNRLIARVEIAIGQVAEVEVHPREVFRPAIRLAAAGIILIHNHPSGDPSPSDHDLRITRRLREAGDLLGIPVIDHVVIAAQGFRSIHEQMGSSW